MGRRCPVCDSPFVDEYDEMIRKGVSYMDTWRYARQEHGETFSYKSMRNHGKYHVKKVDQIRLRQEATRSKHLKEETRKMVNVARRINTMMKVLSDQLDQLTEKSQSDRETRREIRETIGKLNDVLALALRFWDQLNRVVDFEDKERIFSTIIKAMEEARISPEQINRFIEIWRRNV